MFHHRHHLYGIVAEILDFGQDICRKFLVSPDPQIRRGDADYHKVRSG